MDETVNGVGGTGFLDGGTEITAEDEAFIIEAVVSTVVVWPMVQEKMGEDDGDDSGKVYS